MIYADSNSCEQTCQGPLKNTASSLSVVMKHNALVLERVRVRVGVGGGRDLQTSFPTLWSFLALRHRSGPEVQEWKHKHARHYRAPTPQHQLNQMDWAVRWTCTLFWISADCWSGQKTDQ